MLNYSYSRIPENRPRKKKHVIKEQIKNANGKKNKKKHGKKNDNLKTLNISIDYGNLKKCKNIEI